MNQSTGYNVSTPNCILMIMVNKEDTQENMREIFLENSSNNIFSLGNPKLHNKIIKSQIDSIITTTTTKEKHNFLSSSVLKQYYDMDLDSGCGSPSPQQAFRLNKQVKY